MLFVISVEKLVYLMSTLGRELRYKETKVPDLVTLNNPSPMDTLLLLSLLPSNFA